VIANTYSRILDLDSPASQESEAAEVKARVRYLLETYRLVETLVTDMDTKLATLATSTSPKPIRRILVAMSNLACDSQLRAALLAAGAAKKLVQFVHVAPDSPLGSTLVELALAADVMRRCAATDEHRQTLKAAGAEGALDALGRLANDDKGAKKSFSTSAKCGLSRVEEEMSAEALSLQRAVGQAQDALAGRALHSGSLSTLLELKRAAHGGWTESKLRKLPCFPAFISHKRSSAQESAGR